MRRSLKALWWAVGVKRRESNRKLGVFFVGLGITLILVAAAIFIYTSSTPAFVTRQFTWDQFGAVVVVSFRSDGPLSAQNAISAYSAAVYCCISHAEFNASGSRPHVIVNGDVNSSGSIDFTMPPLVPAAKGSNFARVVGYVTPVGAIIPSTAGRMGLYAFVSLTINGVMQQGWSQYLPSPSEPPKVYIDVGATSELAAAQGLKIAAVGLLAVSAVGVLPAFAAALKVLRKGG